MLFHFKFAKEEQKNKEKNRMMDAKYVVELWFIHEL